VSAEERVPKDHPLRAIRTLVDEVLREMSREFDGCTRASAALDSAGVPAAGAIAADLYSIRSERLLMEQLDYNLLFRWFVGMDMDEPIWAPTVFTKNRDRLLNRRSPAAFSGGWSSGRRA
jgi:transposase